MDLDWLAAPRRHHQALDPGVHPGERVPLFPAGKQAIALVHPDSVMRAAQMPTDDAFDKLEALEDEAPVAALAQIGGDRLEQPERRVHRVVLGRLAAIREPVWNQSLVEVAQIGF